MDEEEQENHQQQPEPNSIKPKWHHQIHALTHILTHPTATPSLHSQLFVSSHLPSYLRHQNWDYPPLAPSFRWSLSLFLRRVSNLCLPHTSWRSKCPFQLPPPLVLCSAVEPAPDRWGAEERRGYFRRRLGRRRLGIEVAPIVGLTVPNLVLFSLLLWDPLFLRQQPPPPPGT